MPVTDERTSCALLAGRHHGLAEGVRGLLESAFDTVVMVADEASLLETAERLTPDLAVIDLSLARSGGLGWVRELRRRCPALKVIVLSIHDEPCVNEAALVAGADAVVMKRAIVSDLMATVDALRAEPSAAGHRQPESQARR